MPVGTDLHLGLAGAKAEEGVVPRAHDPVTSTTFGSFERRIGGHFLVIIVVRDDVRGDDGADRDLDACIVHVTGERASAARGRG